MKLQIEFYLGSLYHDGSELLLRTILTVITQ